MRDLVQDRGRGVLPAPVSVPEPAPFVWSPQTYGQHHRPPRPAHPACPGHRRGRAARGEVFLLAGPMAGLDDLSLLAPLDPAVSARALADLGFVLLDTEQPPTPDDLTGEGCELGNPDEVLLQTAGLDGTLRALFIDRFPLPTTPAAMRLRGGLHQLATQLGARLTSSADDVED